MAHRISRRAPDIPRAFSAESRSSSPPILRVHPSGLTQPTRVPYSLLLTTAVLLGTLLRALVVMSSSFPIGDGGLFYVMVQDLLAHHLVLPLTTSYNAGHIPFAYPPLGFYLVAILHLLTGLSILQLFRVVPLVASVMSIGAFALLARALLPSRLAATISVFAFALLPNTFHWEIKGGGITRSLGLLFALLAIHQMILMYRRAGRTHLLLAIVLASLTVVSHLEWALNLACSVVILFLFVGRTRSRVRDTVLLALGTCGLTAAWWIPTMTRHGVVPFLTALTVPSQDVPWTLGIMHVLTLKLTDEVLFPMGTALALCGVLACIARRQWLLPSWLLAVMVTSMRSQTDRDIIVVALLAGLGFADLILPLLLRAPVPSSSLVGELSSRSARRPIALAAGFLVLETMFATSVAVTGTPPSVSAQDRGAMQWVATHTPTTSRFLVITSQTWSWDDVAEWFPALTDRESVTTVQGTEWIPGAFGRRFRENKSAQRCANQSVDCLQRWLARTHARVDYLFIVRRPPESQSADCCSALRTSLDHDTGYVRVFHSTDVSIYRTEHQSFPSGSKAG